MGSNSRLLVGRTLWWLLWLTPALDAQHADRWPTTFLESASLHSVACIDKDVAWAVGERGVMLSTRDGGATWNLHPTRFTSNTLHGVSFSDQQHGIAVGGDARPYGLPSAGVVLRTRDAGQTWKSADRLVLPQLRKITHLEAATALAIGDGSPLFLSGIFRTADGGRTWNCIPTHHVRNWESGDLSNPEQLLLTSCQGQLARCAGSHVIDIPSLPRFQYDIHDAAWMSPDHAIAVGSHGTVIESVDQGRTWQPVTSLTRFPLAGEFDFRTVWARHGCVWLAGAPGTHVFRSADDGQTWSVATTGQSLPLNSFDFSDPQHGIAVGDLGLVLVTRDGGTTWTVSRGEHRRAGLLVACQTDADVPWDLIAQLSCIDQLHCHVLWVDARSNFLSPAMTAAKLAGADNVGALGRNDPAMRDAQLVRQLLAYRPDIVVVAENATRPDAPPRLRRLMDHAIQTAAATAGRQTPAAWSVKRLYYVVPRERADAESITINLDSAILPLKSSMSAVVIEADSFLQPTGGSSLAGSDRGSPLRGTCLARDGAVGEPLAAGTILGGLQLPFDSESRRPLPEPNGEESWLRRRATAYLTTISLMERAISASRDSDAPQLASFTRELPAEDRARLLMWAVDRCRQSGRPALAQQTLDTVLQMQSHDDPQTAATLAQFRGSVSSELQQFLAADRHADWTPAPSAEPAGAPQTGHASSPNAVSVNMQPRKKINATADVTGLLENLAPDVTSQPWVQLSLASARRRVAAPEDRHRIFKLLQSKVADVEWRRCVAIECWLADLQPDPRRPVPPDVVFVPRTRIPPVLDGHLTEPAWRETATVELTSAEPRGTATTVRIATDDLFLFLAFECKGGASSTEAMPQSSQPLAMRDADLRAHDHVEIYLDVDRDYGTGWQISVDSAGRAADRVDGNPAWNPTWYLATQRNADGWIAELAIPLKELSTDIPVQDRCASTWLASFRRKHAVDSVQTWPGSAGGDFSWQRGGYLVFADGRSPAPQVRSATPARTMDSQAAPSRRSRSSGNVTEPSGEASRKPGTSG